jgi:hypothetical protein
MDMSDEEKEEFIKKVAPDMVWRMAEGNPKQDTDVTSGGEKIMFLPTETINKHDINGTTTGENNISQGTS